MKMKAIKNILFKSSSFLIGIIFLVSCQPERSKTTGWHYNNPNDKGSGYEKFPAMDQETGPGLTLIEGGFFIMGSTEELEFMPSNDKKKRVTVPSFYLDQTEVSNFDYLEYLFWLRRVYGSVDVLNPNRYEPDKKSEDEEGEEGNEEDEEFDPSKKAFYKFQENYSESFTSNYQEVR
jgi:formylglycine-generating enzyme required for sulfatase activity